MQRRIGALLLLWVASTAVGCAMCAAPDDYCGPVPGSGLGFNDRVGSILSGGGPGNMTFNGEVTEEAIGEGVVTEGVSGEMTQEGAMMGRPTPAPPQYAPASSQYVPPSAQYASPSSRREGPPVWR